MNTQDWEWVDRNLPKAKSQGTVTGDTQRAGIRSFLFERRHRIGDVAFWLVFWTMVILLTSGALTNNSPENQPLRVEVSCDTGQLLTWQDKYHGVNVCYKTQP